MKYNIVYKTTCVKTDKFYIGIHSTNNLDDGYLGTGIFILNSIKKYGRKDHIREIIEFCQSREDLIKRESEIVNDEMLLNEKCMNLRTGGYARNRMSKISCQKISLAKIGKKRGEAFGRLMSDKLTGRNLSTEHRKNISDGLRGRVVSLETRRKLSLKGKGRVFPKSFGIKISKSLTGRQLSKEHKENISKGNLGKKRSKESRKNISDGRRGMVFSEGHRKNISKSKQMHNEKLIMSVIRLFQKGKQAASLSREFNIPLQSLYRNMKKVATKNKISLAYKQGQKKKNG